MGEVIEIRSFKSGKKYRLLIYNIQSLDISLSSPISATPLPLEGDASNILTKAEGNTVRVTVSWVLHDEDTDIVLQNPYDITGTNVGGGTTPFGLFSDPPTNSVVDTGVRLADNQAKFLINNQADSSPAYSGFQTTYLDDVYQIIIGNIGFSRVGLIESVQVTKQGSTPVTWSASLTFVAGDVITS